MYLDNLSASVLRLIEEQDLTYESASERCDLSAQHFGSIVRGKTALSVPTLEKLCVWKICTISVHAPSVRVAGFLWEENTKGIVITAGNAWIGGSIGIGAN